MISYTLDSLLLECANNADKTVTDLGDLTDCKLFWVTFKRWSKELDQFICVQKQCIEISGILVFNCRHNLGDFL